MKLEQTSADNCNLHQTQKFRMRIPLSLWVSGLFYTIWSLLKAFQPREIYDICLPLLPQAHKVFSDCRLYFGTHNLDFRRKDLLLLPELPFFRTWNIAFGWWLHIDDEDDAQAAEENEPLKESLLASIARPFYLHLYLLLKKETQWIFSLVICMRAWTHFGGAKLSISSVMNKGHQRKAPPYILLCKIFY